MRVLNIHGVDDVRLDPRAPPRPGDNDVVVRVKACGICGSDLSYIKTEMTGSGDEWSGMDKFFASKTPIQRPGYMKDFEGIAAYLASDASAFHTGDTIVIDGGSVILPAYISL